MMAIDVQTLIPLFVAVPLGMSLLVQLVARRRHAVAETLTIITLLVLTLMSGLSVGQSGIYHLGGWPTPVGIDMRLDALATLLLLVVSVVGLAVSLYSVDYMRRFTARSHFYSLFLLMVTGMNGVILAGDLFNLYVFLEVAAIASYSLVAFGCAHEELEASFKYIVLGSLSSALILTGVALVYGITGTLNLAHIASRIAETGMSMPLLLAFGLFICGFAFKAALVPFHAWLPDAHPSAPAPVSAMLSGVLIKAIGVYVLARLAFNVFGIGANELQPAALAGPVVDGCRRLAGSRPEGHQAPVRLQQYFTGRFYGAGTGAWHPFGAGRRPLPPGQPCDVQVPAVPQCRRNGIRNRQPGPAATGWAQPPTAGHRPRHR